MKTRFLVTGGAGFIGSHFIERLLINNRNEVICLDNLDDFYSSQVKKNRISVFSKFSNFLFIEGDIRCHRDIQKAGQVDIIIHLAAKAGIQFSIIDPQSCIDHNVSGTLELLKYARDIKVRKFIFASSSSVYGANLSLPWNEQSVVRPINPYGRSKATAELLGHNFSQLYGINFLALRFFSVYGPGQRPDLVISKFFYLIGKELPIEIYGDGSSSRDYTYISDVIDAMEKAIHMNFTGSDVMNIGSGSPVLLTDIVREVERICEKKAIIEQLEPRKGEAISTYADLKKANEKLSFRPKINIKQGLLLYHQSLLASA